LRLADLGTGSCDLSVTSPSGDAAVYYSGVFVEPRREQLWVNVVGRQQIRMGRVETYWIGFGNAGNTDVYDLVLDLAVPDNAEYSISFPHPPDDNVDWSFVAAGVDAGTAISIPIWLLRLAPSSSYEFTLSLRVPSGDSGDIIPIRAVLWEAPSSRFSETGDFQQLETSPVFSSLALSVWEALPENGKAERPPLSTVRGVLSQETGEVIGTFFPTWAVIGAGGCALIGMAFGNPLLGGVVGAQLGALVDSALFIWKLKMKEMNLISRALGGIDVELVRSVDPNEKAGPAGFGIQHWVSPDESMRYVIFFENLATATAPAEEIVVTDTLATGLDWSTVQFGSTSHSATHMTLDESTGVLKWTFQGINLPPNRTPPEGEGWVSFSVRSVEDLGTGTQLRNRAWIVFDANPQMSTAEVLNTIDASPPSSGILALAEQQYYTAFELDWRGDDEDRGSGIRSYTVYVSEDSAPYVPWLTTSALSATFVGTNGHTYRFYSVARDNVGHSETPPVTPDAVTT
ncbi:MAG: DUF1269 domain-containing protein, partial [Deltaproteobacteria bacterium]|nr:DUF1269 domain-containing protein [Deltaproteobacteria bacterium]